MASNVTTPPRYSSITDEIDLPSRHPVTDSRNQPPKSVNKLIIGEAIIGSLLILAAPFLGDYFEPVGGGKVLAVVLAVGHYAFHLIGGAILFKAGLDWGRHGQH